MIEAFKFVLMIIGGATLVFFMIGLLVASFHTEPIPDKVEEALEEVTKRRKRK